MTKPYKTKLSRGGFPDKEFREAFAQDWLARLKTAANSQTAEYWVLWGWEARNIIAKRERRELLAEFNAAWKKLPITCRKLISAEFARITEALEE